ncbi:hypothetical protein [Nonomuraea jabiensis]
MAETRAWPDKAVIAAARDGDAESIAALVSGAHPHVRRFGRLGEGVCDD